MSLRHVVSRKSAQRILSLLRTLWIRTLIKYAVIHSVSQSTPMIPKECTDTVRDARSCTKLIHLQDDQMSARFNRVRTRSRTRRILSSGAYIQWVSYNILYLSGGHCNLLSVNLHVQVNTAANVVVYSYKRWTLSIARAHGVGQVREAFEAPSQYCWIIILCLWPCFGGSVNFKRWWRRYLRHMPTNCRGDVRELSSGWRIVSVFEVVNMNDTVGMWGRLIFVLLVQLEWWRWVPVISCLYKGCFL